MKAKTSKTIEIKIGRFNEKTEAVNVKAGSSIEEVLKEANIDLDSSESLWVDGEKAELSYTVEDGDFLQIVGKKEGGK